jgi:hypothetical protein
MKPINSFILGDDHQPSKVARILAASNKKSVARTTPTSSIGAGREKWRGRGCDRGRLPGSIPAPPLMFESLKSSTQTVKRKGFSLGHIFRLRGVLH